MIHTYSYVYPDGSNSENTLLNALADIVAQAPNRTIRGIDLHRVRQTTGAVIKRELKPTIEEDGTLTLRIIDTYEGEIVP